MSNRTFVIFVSLVVVLGATTGYRLSSFPRLEVYKLVNIAGLLYDLLGVLVLSELVASSLKWKRIFVDTVAPAVLWLHMVFPLGALLGAFLAGVLAHSPSWGTVAKFGVGFWSYSIIPLSLLEMTVAFPPFTALKGLESRWRRFGLYLLLSGVGLQLIAAVLGLKS